MEVPEVEYPLAGVTPLPGLTGGTRGGYPLAEVPSPPPGSMGVPLVGVSFIQVQRGYPRWGIPRLDLAKVPPPRLDLARVPPLVWTDRWTVIVYTYDSLYMFCRMMLCHTCLSTGRSFLDRLNEVVRGAICDQHRHVRLLQNRGKQNKYKRLTCCVFPYQCVPFSSTVLSLHTLHQIS